MISVIIAQRNEAYLRQTVASIVKACGRQRPEVIVVNDGQPAKPPDVPKWVRALTPWETPRGCQAARDWGIINAEGRHCVVIDGHMDFDIGLFGGFADHLHAHPQDVLCAHTPGLNPVTWQRENHVCSGAFFLWKDGGATALSLKWRYTYDTGEIPGVLGACYGIDREWYVDGLARPWQYGTGWGCDEETLSICNWMCGGRNIVMPFDAAHWFRSPQQVPYPHDALLLGGLYANRLRLLDMLPMDAAWRKELSDAIWSAETARTQERAIKAFLARHDVTEYRTWIEMQGRSFAEWRRLWCADVNPQDNPAAVPPGIAVTALERTADIRAEMAAWPGEPVTPAPAPPPAPKRKHPEPNIVVVDPGVRCPHCHALYEHKVTHVYPNGNRRRICNGCGRPFVSMRVSDRY